MTRGIEAQIARCESCVGGPIFPDWLPVSYFGDYRCSNAWVLSINPSHREFIDRNAQALEGTAQRFRRLADFNAADGRAQLAREDIESAIDYQDTYFTRPGVAYRPFFNRLGRFLGKLHGAEVGQEPLRPFMAGVRANGGRIFRYAHLDIVKCATQTPWGRLHRDERDRLMSNCGNYLEEQLATHARLRLILMNGRTVFSHCRPFLVDRFGFTGTSTKLRLGHTSSEVWTGTIAPNGHEVQVVGWSANVVNQQISASALDTLAMNLRRACPALC